MPRPDSDLNRQARKWLDELSKTEFATPQWEEAIDRLASLGPAVSETLIDAMADKNRAVHCGAGKALRCIGLAIIPFLIKGLKHPNAAVREHVALMLYGLQPADSVVALPELTDALNDRSMSVRWAAAVALERLAWDLGPAIKSAVPSLIETLQDEDFMLREWSAKALGSIGEEAAAAIPFLQWAMVDDVPSVREAAINALNTISPPQWTDDDDA